ncbi:unnamed protein product [Pleuronectes platessa]|uniref:Uncharacterized protein n=1 Tax=Pleuronectes platessa TaxID=8262 RepID=A0A9N7ZEG6_PLEPL|nr:unnamed protein product [Pleuronectes platessa]
MARIVLLHFPWSRQLAREGAPEKQRWHGGVNQPTQPSAALYKMQQCRDFLHNKKPKQREEGEKVERRGKRLKIAEQSGVRMHQHHNDGKLPRSRLANTWMVGQIGGMPIPGSERDRQACVGESFSLCGAFHTVVVEVEEQLYSLCQAHRLPRGSTVYLGSHPISSGFGSSLNATQDVGLLANPPSFLPPPPHPSPQHSCTKLPKILLDEAGGGGVVTGTKKEEGDTSLAWQKERESGRRGSHFFQEPEQCRKHKGTSATGHNTVTCTCSLSFDITAGSQRVTCGRCRDRAMSDQATRPSQDRGSIRAAGNEEVVWHALQD